MIIRDNFCLFCLKTYVVIPNLKRLKEMVQMRGHNIWFRLAIRKIIIKYSGHNIWFRLAIRKIIIKYSLLSGPLTFMKLYNWNFFCDGFRNPTKHESIDFPKTELNKIYYWM